MLRRLDPWVRCDVSPHMAHNMDCGSLLPQSKAAVAAGAVK
jgi:hypothetical protein